MSRPRSRHATPRRHTNPMAFAVGGLAVLVAVALLVLHTRATSRPDRDPDGAPVFTVGPADSPGPAPMTVQLTWPADLTWVTVAGLGLPVSATAGPHDLADGRARGFSQSPSGAIFAGLHLLVRTSPQVGPRVWAPTLREQVVGPDAAAFTDAVAQSYDDARQQLQLSYGEPLGRIAATIGGIRIDGYSEHAASLRVLIEAPAGDGRLARAALLVQVAWSGTDWQLVAPPRGDWAAVRTLVPSSVSGYTPLPGR